MCGELVEAGRDLDAHEGGEAVAGDGGGGDEVPSVVDMGIAAGEAAQRALVLVVEHHRYLGIGRRGRALRDHRAADGARLGAGLDAQG